MKTITKINVYFKLRGGVKYQRSKCAPCPFAALSELGTVSG